MSVDSDLVLRNLLAACDRGRPLSDIHDRLRVEVGRLDGEYRPLRRVCDDCIGASDGEAVACVHMFDSFAYDDEAGRYQCLRCDQWSDEDGGEGTIEHLDDCPSRPAGPWSIDEHEPHRVDGPQGERIRCYLADGTVSSPELAVVLARLLNGGRPAVAEPTAAPTRPTREQVWALDRLVRAAVESARDPHGMTLTVDETTDAVIDQLIEEAPAFVALLAAQDEFSTTPNKEGDGCDNEHLTRGRTRPVDGPVLQGAEGAGLQRGERRDADGAGLRDRPHAVEAPRDLTEPSGALADAGEGTTQPDPRALTTVPLDGSWELMHVGEDDQPRWVRFTPKHHLASVAADSAVYVIARPWEGMDRAD